MSEKYKFYLSSVALDHNDYEDGGRGGGGNVDDGSVDLSRISHTLYHNKTLRLLISKNVIMEYTLLAQKATSFP